MRTQQLLLSTSQHVWNVLRRRAGQCRAGRARGWQQQRVPAELFTAPAAMSALLLLPVTSPQLSTHVCLLCVSALLSLLPQSLWSCLVWGTAHRTRHQRWSTPSLRPGCSMPWPAAAAAMAAVAAAAGRGRGSSRARQQRWQHRRAADRLVAVGWSLAGRQVASHGSRWWWCKARQPARMHGLWLCCCETHNVLVVPGLPGGGPCCCLQVVRGCGGGAAATSV